MHRPNVMIHMLLWGAALGTALATIYILFIMVLIGIGDGIALFGLIYFALPFGTVPGLILGFVDGLLLWYLLSTVSFPLSSLGMQNLRYRVYAICGATTGIGGLLLSIAFFRTLTPLIGVPAFIAAGAAIYAGYRYMLRMEAAMADLDKPKNKPKTSVVAPEEALR